MQARSVCIGLPSVFPCLFDTAYHDDVPILVAAASVVRVYDIQQIVVLLPIRVSAVCSKVQSIQVDSRHQEDDSTKFRSLLFDKIRPLVMQQIVNVSRV